MEDLLKKLTLDFFGERCHKIVNAKLFNPEKAVFLDVCIVKGGYAALSDEMKSGKVLKSKPEK